MLADRPAPGERAATSATAAAVVARQASSHIFMSANRCLSAWYDASGRPKVYRSSAHCDGEVQHRLQDADHLGALQHLRDLALPRRSARRSRRRLPTAADCVHLDAVEMHPRIPLDQVDRLLRLDPDARRIRRNQELAHRASPQRATTSKHTHSGRPPRRGP